ncbi:MAG: mshD [Rhodocyclaceae bacterium]|nr:mshD [Rhodocyclaceae bacterium]
MRNSSGFTLVEMIVFVVVVSVGLAGILLPITNSVRHSADPMIARQLVLVADSLMDEIMAKDSLVAGYSGTARSQFDGVMNYQGYSTAGISAVDGSTIAGLGQYSVVVNIQGAALSGVAAADGRRIEIRVTHVPTAESLVLEGYRLAYE